MMAAIVPEALYGNIERSLQRYIQAEIATDLGVPVWYQYGPSVETVRLLGVARWIDVTYIDLGAAGEPKYRPGGYSVWTQMLVNLNCFELDDRRTDGSGEANIYSLSELVDGVRGAFTYGASITVYDYSLVADPAVGALRVAAKPAVRHVATPPSLAVTQRNVSATLAYVETVLI